MELIADDGTCFALTPTAYQFPGTTEIADPGLSDYDANWLLISGRLTLPDGRTWAFQDPCLTTWEAHHLGRWLADAAAGVELPPVHDGHPTIQFTEPNLRFLLDQRTEDDFTLRVYLSAESAPPFPLRDNRGQPTNYAPITGSPKQLRDAAKAWQRELEGFPVVGR